MKKTSIITKLLTYLSPRWTIHCGLLHNENGFVFLKLAKNSSGSIRVLSYGTTQKPFLLSVPPPAGINTALQNTMVSFFSAPLHGEEVETWIDRNEERVISHGFKADQIIHEWDVYDNTIYSCSITKEAFLQYTNSASDLLFLYNTISAPLWDLAILYARYVAVSFVLWKVTGKGSLFGYVHKGKVCSLCQFWMDYGDLNDLKPDTRYQIESMVKSLTSGDKVNRIIVWCDRSEYLNRLATISIPGYSIEKPPEINGVPLPFHEVYACALHEKTYLDFTDFSDTQKVESLQKKRRHFLSFLFISCTVLVSIGVLSALITIGTNFYQSKLNARIKPLNTSIAKIEKIEKRIDSLRTVSKKKSSFLNRKSAITFLLYEFQNTFPEGVWAEQIDISEIEGEKWRIHIIALSFSSALIPLFLSQLEALDGIENVRMMYSEQTETEDKKHAIKMSVECFWMS